MPDQVPYYLAAQVRELDRLAIEEHGIPGFTLMQRAAQAAFATLLDTWPTPQQIICFCGSGNNGGDGYVIAALATQAGLDACAVAVGNPGQLKGDALLAFQLAQRHSVAVIAFTELPDSFAATLPRQTVIVDAMLGTGLTGAVRGDYKAAIDLINTLPTPVLAVDIPSGLCSDTGAILGTAVSAEVTVTFIGRKLGQILAQGPACCGKLVFDDLAVPAAVYSGISPTCL